MLNYAKSAISQQLPILCGLSDSGFEQTTIDVSKLGSTVRIELGTWLRQQVAQFVEVNEQ